MEGTGRLEDWQADGRYIRKWWVSSCQRDGMGERLKLFGDHSVFISPFKCMLRSRSRSTDGPA